MDRIHFERALSKRPQSLNALDAAKLVHVLHRADHLERD